MIIIISFILKSWFSSLLFMFFHLTGDQEMTGGSHYWELCPLVDWKSFSVGVAYRASLGRFDQLGKNSGSWCLHASQWLQSSLCVKHNNRVKALDWPLPQRIGIYCDYNNGLHFLILPLVFYVFILTLNPSNKRLSQSTGRSTGRPCSVGRTKIRIR